MPKGTLKVHKPLAKRLGVKASGDLGDVSQNVFNDYGGLKSTDPRFHLMSTQSPRAYLKSLTKDDD